MYVSYKEFTLITKNAAIMCGRHKKLLKSKQMGVSVTQSLSIRDEQKYLKIYVFEGDK